MHMYNKVLIKSNWEIQDTYFLTAFVKLLYLAPAQQKPLTCATSLFVFSGNEISQNSFWEYLNLPLFILFHLNYVPCKNELLVVKFICLSSLTLFLCWIQRTFPTLLPSVLLILPDSTQQVTMSVAYIWSKKISPHIMSDSKKIHT